MHNNKKTPKSLILTFVVSRFSKNLQKPRFFKWSMLEEIVYYR